MPKEHLRLPSVFLIHMHIPNTHTYLHMNTYTHTCTQNTEIGREFQSLSASLAEKRDGETARVKSYPWH